jgi:5-methylcytosine-specific restriction endonuclease McrA
MTYTYPFASANAQLRLSVWGKGEIVPGYGANVRRRDRFGGWMQYNEHGNTSSQYGWEIDHIKPVAKGGTDQLSNLQPLYWQNNRTKGDNWP